MASTTKDALIVRHARQHDELNNLITVQQDALAVKLTAAHDALLEAGKADDPAAIAAANDAITSLLAQQAKLKQDIELKQHAFAESARLIEVERRQAAVANAQALIREATPLAATVAQSLYAYVAALQALAANRAATATALTGYNDDVLAFHSVSNMLSTYADGDFHVKAALSIPQDAGPTRGDSVMQQAMVAQLADSIR